MLSNKEKQELFALSNKLKTKYVIGKGNITDKVFDMLDKALNANELIKISINKNAEIEVDELVTKICEKLQCTLIKIIGRTVVFYRPSPKRVNK